MTSLSQFLKLRPAVYDVMKVSKSFFENSEPSHDWFHVERVTKLAWKICLTEPDSDPEIVVLSALLHDTKRNEEHLTGKDHATEGALFAKNLLTEMKFDSRVIKKVYDSIFCHRYSAGIEPSYLEGKILQDSDRLDAIGAIAIARVFAYNRGDKLTLYDPEIKPKEVYDGISKTHINHFYEKILKIDPESFWTSEASIIATNRHSFTSKFVERFIAEWKLEEN